VTFSLQFLNPLFYIFDDKGLNFILTESI